MNLGAWLDLLGAVLVLGGSFFCLSAAIGLVRFPDVLTRMHAATKPQVFGLLLILTGIGLSIRTWQATGLLLLVGLFQLITAPVSAHMVSRTAYRIGAWNNEDAIVDELAEDLAESGFIALPGGGFEPPASQALAEPPTSPPSPA